MYALPLLCFGLVRRPGVVTMLSRLMGLPTPYFFLIVLALLALGWIINAVRPAEGIGLIISGICQIVIGVCILALAFAFIKNRLS